MGGVPRVTFTAVPASAGVVYKAAESKKLNAAKVDRPKKRPYILEPP
jgi:hypothetical protein